MIFIQPPRTRRSVSPQTVGILTPMPRRTGLSARPGRFSSLQVSCWIVPLFLFCCGAVPAQMPEIIVETDRQQIYEGESIVYRVTLNHVDNPTAPELDGFDAFRIESLGEQSMNSQQVTIINGRRSEIIRRGRQYNYRLTPLTSGTVLIPAPTAVVDGKTLTGREVAVEVIPPQQQSIVLLEMSVDRESVYPMQPFTVSLKMLVRELPGELSSRDPLSVQPSPPKLQAAWLDDDGIPNGLKVRESWREILEPIVSRGGRGVQINNIGSQSAFSLFGREATTFMPRKQSVKRTHEDGEVISYVEYTLQRTLIPERIGRYDLGNTTVKGTFATDIRNGRLAGEDVFAVSESISIEVKDVPLENRPDSYIGAVGVFEVSSQLVPEQASVGDPMTLTVSLTGTGTLLDARAPRVDQLLQPGFRTYEATEETTEDAKRFTYSLRPLTTEVSAVPAIPVSWFDVEREQYVTAQTNPIPVVISSAEHLAAADIVAGNAAPATTELTATANGLFANHSNLAAQSLESIQLGFWLKLWCTMIAVYGLATVFIRRSLSRSQNPDAVRRRAARARAQSALAAISDTDHDRHEDRLNEAVSRIISGMIADFTGRPESGMTSSDAQAALVSAGASEKIRAETIGFLQQCDAARYGAHTGNSTDLLGKGRQVIHDLARELEKRC